MDGRERKGRKRRKQAQRLDGIPSVEECREFCRAADKWLAKRGVKNVDDLKFGRQGERADRE